MNYLRRTPIRIAARISHHSRCFTSKNNRLRSATTGKSSSRPSAAGSKAPPTDFAIAYIHPLSQLVLQHFQRHYHAWITVHGMDSLRLHPDDGTFCLGNGDTLQVWTYFHQGHHGLAVAVHNQRQHFVLQDNNPGGTYTKASSPLDRVQACVQSVVEVVDATVGSRGS